ncbi:MAG: 50S ribosomal protein L22 [Bacilli bacterium]|jgi:large subunit ribosomal protein L22|nr:50S ribosomal protein L22 [Bacilli bacterium]
MAKKEKAEVKTPTRTEARCFVDGIHITPRKMRLVIDLVRGKDLPAAYALLANTVKAPVDVVAKAIHSAEANAVNNFHMEAGKLYIASIQVGDGPRLKRMEPRAKGSSSPYMKRMSNLTVVLKAKGEEK